MREQSYDIAQFIFELSEIPSSDPLVQLFVHEKAIVHLDTALIEKQEFSLTGNWSSVLKTALLNKRESDLHSLCWAFGTVSWEYKSKEVRSPLVLVPLEWKILKGKHVVEIRCVLEEAFINPFVRNHLVREFELTLPDHQAQSAEDLLVSTRGFLEEKAFPIRIEEASVIGNFHHHRYQIVRELERIQAASSRSSLVETILGNEAPITDTFVDFSSELLSPADADQLKVFEQIKTANTVIQGPPGTGKSQVLTNLLGKSLVRDGFTLVVSEKRVALDVLVKKLGVIGLSEFTFTAHSQTRPNVFIQQLKFTWNALEQEIPVTPASLLLSEQLIDSLQLLLDRLNSPTLIGGISFQEFQDIRSTYSSIETTFNSDVPDLKTWIELEPALRELEQQLGSFTLFQAYKKTVFADEQFDQLLQRIHAEADWVCNTFAVSTFGELEELITAVARCQLIANESFRVYFTLAQQPKERKRFEKTRLLYRELSAKMQVYQSEQLLWKKLPTRSEATSWLNQLSEKQSWFARRKWRKLFFSHLKETTLDPATVLTNWLHFINLEEQLIDARALLATWGIERPEVELESAAYVLRQLEQEDPNELNRVAKLTHSERQLILSNGERLKHLAHDINRYLDVSSATAFSSLFSDRQLFIEKSLTYRSIIHQLPDAVYRLLASGKSLSTLAGIVLYSNWRKIETQFPVLAKFDGATLEEKIRHILATEQDEFNQFAKRIWFLRKERFDVYTQLLRTPAAKLKDSDKALKARLKVGKAILVKEFGKSKQHKTIRELVASDARIWIELLTPIWLSTPAQVGKTFPMERGLFQLAIFDEASQIPLPNALGTLQRAERAVIAGDEQQMAPSSYFSGNKIGVDLLHQASWYWKKVALKHHYRSEHPALIAFSNQHFYQNELVAYPAAKTPYPLHRHFVADGVFEDRINIREAQSMALFLEHINWKKSVGIVAFSEQQLACIWQNCSPKVQECITVGMEKDRVFFKALEQVQGDEADLLVIGLGYGKNARGDFHLRFGPLNQSQGYKRLNVLLTRAKSELHFFTSVTASDFSISTNESVNLLRLYLLDLEQVSTEKKPVFPYELVPASMTESELHLPDITTKITNAHDLVTFHRVMVARGWKLRY